MSGSHTATLSINPAYLADGGQYRIIATNTASAAVTSAVVLVTIFSTNVDVTQPGDPITDFGNTSTTTPGFATENQFSAFTTRGSGLNNNAGFPPFGGGFGHHSGLGRYARDRIARLHRQRSFLPIVRPSPLIA